MKIVYEGPSWDTVRTLVKRKFAAVGLLDTCEVRYEICDNYHLTFAHSLRRNYIGNLKQMEEVVRACQKCHTKLDAQKRHETYAEVRAIIKKRVVPVESIYEDIQHKIRPVSAN